MSKITMTICDGCRREITGKPNEPELCLTVTLAIVGMTCHYCRECSVEILDMINKITEKNLANGR